ncbi:reverse transcriptase domain-containing protein [Mesorhizobium sp. VK23B]|uniref:Reverse transcriptase domain-containing protein n=1 Tax=Mesorhizobium dulcispinae TaxID=3072316 RepID=A0ABU4XDT8_9HYPH|nr:MULTISPECIES: reverse transcriptase domain-containing protein [unclassified Mesorhizobium]MDX8465407.1 reverse transcriptase domain-containing protein [Mesorhizobium sp. VK23B]MDX8472949.1 reverse transcriptase domain-containing protein [Mesorhizobium sp. VK23A]
MSVLVAAWHAIRRNAETSQQEKTKLQARKFGENLPANLRQLQERLRLGYRFDKAYGATPPKGPGKPGKRPIVVAPLEDRIVQRAILDVLQSATEISEVQRVLQTPTSIGGIRGRGVDHAIALFDERVNAGDRFVAGSDISGFFTKIPRSMVIEFLKKSSIELGFVQLVEDALTIELSNWDQLSENDRKLFPTGEDGVAQGCPLSALAGNIVLEEFDKRMNARDITCIRYIDDFIVTGKTFLAVKKAMAAAKAILAELGMDIYDPIKSPNKAFIGHVGEGQAFLGYKLLPGSYPPADAARRHLMDQICALIASGQNAIRKAVTDRALTSRDRCYVQTHTSIDHTIRGGGPPSVSPNAQRFSIKWIKRLIVAC